MTALYMVNFEAPDLHQHLNIQIGEFKSKLKVNSLKNNEIMISVMLQYSKRILIQIKIIYI